MAKMRYQCDFWFCGFEFLFSILAVPFLVPQKYGYGYGGKTGVTGCSNLKEPIKEFKELIVCDTLCLDSAKVF